MRYGASAAESQNAMTQSDMLLLWGTSGATGDVSVTLEWSGHIS